MFRPDYSFRPAPGLSAVSRDTAGSAPRYPIRPLPDDEADIATLKRWFRQFIEVRDAEGGVLEPGLGPAMHSRDP